MNSRKCDWCGDEFARPRTLDKARWEKRRFCRRACYLAWRAQTPESFWAGFDMSGGPETCWPWMRSTARAGYGKVAWHGRLVATHRLAYELTYGPIPEQEDGEPIYVCHRCDNPPCGNPRHLFLGTNSENIQDAVDKGRAGHQTHPDSRKGEHNGRAKLSRDEVLQIVAALLRGETRKGLARQYHVTHTTVRRIATGRLWGHVTGISPATPLQGGSKQP